MNKQEKLTTEQLESLEYVINFYLYEDGLEHGKANVNMYERIKEKFGFEKGEVEFEQTLVGKRVRKENAPTVSCKSKLKLTT